MTSADETADRAPAGDTAPEGDSTPARDSDDAAGDDAGGNSHEAAEQAGMVVAAVTPGLVFRWAVAATLGVFAVLLFTSALYAVRNILVLVVIALFIAVSLDPAVRWLNRRGMRRSIAVALIFGLLIVALAGFAISIVPPLVGQASRLTADLPGYIDGLQERSRTFRELSDRFGLTGKLSELAADLPGRVGASALDFVRRFLGALLSGLTVLVLTIYFMADLPRLRRGFVRLFPKQHRPRVAEVVNVVIDKVGSYMIGNLIISLVAGVVTFIALAALQVPYALPLAVAVAIADLIPLVGATLGAGLCVLVSAFTTNLWPKTVLVLLFFIVYQQVENYLVAPRVLRNTVDISAVAVLLAGLIGATVLGVVGAIMAIPIAAAIKVLITPTIAAMDKQPAPAGEPRAG
jgi:predicted PurR-regulated permease PerM